MSTSRTVRIDVRRDTQAGEDAYRWVLQMTNPVQDLAVSPQLSTTRAGAIADFIEVADLLGWKTMVSLDWEPPPLDIDDSEEPW